MYNNQNDKLKKKFIQSIDLKNKNDLLKIV